MVGIRTTELAAIFFATFENVRGTVIAYQYPADYVSPVQFKEISNAVLPRAELAFRVITVEAFQHYVIGCPQRIEGIQYQRNTLQFNICLVIKPKPCHILDDVTRGQFETEQSAGGLRSPIQLAYEALALKINRFFYNLEEDCAYLSKCIDESTGVGGDTRLPCLDSIFQQLHADGICVYPFDKYGSLYLRFSPQNCGSVVDSLIVAEDELVPASDAPRDPGAELDAIACEAAVIKQNQPRDPRSMFSAPDSLGDLLDECVFVLVTPATSGSHDYARSWMAADCVSQRLLPHINGCNRVLELARLAGVDVSITRMFLANLIQMGMVRALPAPTFLKPPDSRETTAYPISTAGWLGLPRMSVFLSDHLLGKACLDSVVATRRDDLDHPVGRFKALVNIFRVYTMLCGSPNFSMPHLISANPNLRFVDVPDAYQDHKWSESFEYNELAADTSLPLAVRFLHLVQFGEVNGLIRRIQCYPISDKAPCVQSTDTSTALQDVNMSDITNSSATSLRTPNQQGSSIVLSPIQSSGLNQRSTNMGSSLIDDTIWASIRSKILDSLHSVDGISSVLANEIYSSGNHDLPDPASFVSRLNEDLFKRLHTKSPPATTVSAPHDNMPISATLPISWTQRPSVRTTMKTVSASTEESVSAARVKQNPLTRSTHNLMRRMSSIPQGYSTDELRFLIERHMNDRRIADDKTHGLERKANAPSTSTPIPTLYMLWR